MTKQLKRLIWLAALFMILIPAVYVLADETEADHDRFTVSCSEVENNFCRKHFYPWTSTSVLVSETDMAVLYSASPSFVFIRSNLSFIPV